MAKKIFINLPVSNLQKAMDWYVQAARNGDDAAPIKAKELAARIKP